MLLDIPVTRPDGKRLIAFIVSDCDALDHAILMEKHVGAQSIVFGRNPQQPTFRIDAHDPMQTSAYRTTYDCVAVHGEAVWERTVV
jgi:hypothetical protein